MEQLTDEEIAYFRKQKKQKEQFWSAIGIWLSVFTVICAILAIAASIPLIVANHKANPLWNW